MLRTFLNRLPDEHEREYREFYLEADISQSRIAILLFAIPIIGFTFNDYMFFGLSTTFFGLTVIRFIMMLITAIELFYVGNVKSYRSYEVLILCFIFTMLIGGTIINSTRPENFIVHSLIAIVSVFVLYLVVPLKFAYQSFLASLTTVGEALIILFLSTTAQISVAYALLFSMFVANVIAAASSWQLHSYRRRIYEEFEKRKEVQDALEQQANNLSELVEQHAEKLKKAERFAAIGETAGMVGHDLRNPLTAIKNAAYFLKYKGSQCTDAQRAEMLKIIEKSVDHSNKIVTDLLDYSRELHLELKKYSPKVLIEETLATIQIPSTIRIINSVSDKPALHVDVDKMQRVFVNLIKNAIDAMPNGGTLEIISKSDANSIKLLFADSGMGIPKDILPKLFMPFVTTKAQGMGLGLPICKRIIDAHNGTIAVESEVGKGTKFIVNLSIPS